eukprot:GILI01001848.1.p1 GENE.GILI01001848.1~~GILI01001848.1.p1  ORF type:complete len:274 (+),score=82.46 GILI01001848.1:71-823(+)
MSGTGSGYDLSTTTFSPDGRVFQVEYAMKAVDNSSTAIGLRCKDGVILGVEKLIQSKMLVEGTNRRVFSVDKHVGIAISGMVPDARQIVNRARSECSNYFNTYGQPIPAKILADRMSQFVHAYSLYWSARPFGATVLLAVYDQDGPHLHMIEPSGVSWKYFGCAIGKAKSSAKTEIERLDLSNLTCREAAFHVAKILHTVHDSLKDKDFELELSWICPESNFQHRLVPKDVRDDAETRAKEAIEQAEMDE